MWSRCCLLLGRAGCWWWVRLVVQGSWGGWRTRPSGVWCRGTRSRHRRTRPRRPIRSLQLSWQSSQATSHNDWLIKTRTDGLYVRYPHEKGEWRWALNSSGQGGQVLLQHEDSNVGILAPTRPESAQLTPWRVRSQRSATSLCRSLLSCTLQPRSRSVRTACSEGLQLFGSTFSNIAVVMAAAVAFSARANSLAVVIPSRLCMTPVSGSVQGSFVRS